MPSPPCSAAARWRRRPARRTRSAAAAGASPGACAAGMPSASPTRPARSARMAAAPARQSGQRNVPVAASRRRPVATRPSARRGRRALVAPASARRGRAHAAPVAPERKARPVPGTKPAARNRATSSSAAAPARPATATFATRIICVVRELPASGTGAAGASAEPSSALLAVCPAVKATVRSCREVRRTTPACRAPVGGASTMQTVPPAISIAASALAPASTVSARAERRRPGDDTIKAARLPRAPGLTSTRFRRWCRQGDA